MSNTHTHTHKRNDKRNDVSEFTKLEVTVKNMDSEVCHLGDY